MKFITDKVIDGKPVYENVYWPQHQASCERCFRNVDISKSSTFVSACYLGSQLLQEHLVRLQTPLIKEKNRIVREWAKKAGVFHDA